MSFYVNFFFLGWEKSRFGFGETKQSQPDIYCNLLNRKPRELCPYQLSSGLFSPVGHIELVGSTPPGGQIQAPKVRAEFFVLFLFVFMHWQLASVRREAPSPHHRPTPQIKEPLSSFTSAVTPSSPLPPRQVSINLARGWYGQGLPPHPCTPPLIPLIHPSLLASAPFIAPPDAEAADKQTWESESAVHREYS